MPRIESQARPRKGGKGNPSLSTHLPPPSAHHRKAISRMCGEGRRRCIRGIKRFLPASSLCLAPLRRPTWHMRGRWFPSFPRAWLPYVRGILLMKLQEKSPRKLLFSPSPHGYTKVHSVRTVFSLPLPPLSLEEAKKIKRHFLYLQGPPLLPPFLSPNNQHFPHTVYGDISPNEISFPPLPPWPFFFSNSAHFLVNIRAGGGGCT